MSRRARETGTEQKGQARSSGQHGREGVGEASKLDELRCICPFSFHTNPRGGNGFHPKPRGVGPKAHEGSL